MLQGWLGRLKLGTKLSLILIMAVIILIVNGVISVYELRMTTKQLVTALYDNLYQAAQMGLNADRDFYQANLALQTAFMGENALSTYEEAKADFEENAAQVKERMGGVEEILLSEDSLIRDREKVEAMFARFKENYDQWEALSAELFDDYRSNGQVSIGKLQQQNEHFSIARETINEMEETLDADANHYINVIKKQNQQILLYSIIFIAVVVALLFIFGHLLIRNITKPVKRLVDMNMRLAKGELNMDPMPVTSKDEIGILAESVNTMIENLRNLIGNISEISQQVASSSEELSASADQTSTASQEIAKSIEEVSSDTEKQATSNRETARAMTEISSGVESIVGNVQKLRDALNRTEERATQGFKDIETAMKQMEITKESTDMLAQTIETLNQRSNKIGEIMEVITSIAEQTGLLALNASIEAARAGENGRGFAVVASEVKKLSEQSGESAEQISALLEDIRKDVHNTVESITKQSENVEKGNESMNRAGRSFQTIKDSVTEVSGEINEVSELTVNISATAEEVTASADESANISHNVAENVQGVAASTEEQMASVEEISASSQHLSKIAQELSDQISRFRL